MGSFVTASSLPLQGWINTFPTAPLLNQQALLQVPSLVPRYYVQMQKRHWWTSIQILLTRTPFWMSSTFKVKRQKLPSVQFCCWMCASVFVRLRNRAPITQATLGFWTDPDLTDLTDPLLASPRFSQWAPAMLQNGARISSFYVKQGHRSPLHPMA